MRSEGKGLHTFGSGKPFEADLDVVDQSYFAVMARIFSQMSVQADSCTKLPPGPCEMIAHFWCVFRPILDGRGSAIVHCQLQRSPILCITHSICFRCKRAKLNLRGATAERRERERCQHAVRARYIGVDASPFGHDEVRPSTLLQ